VQLALGEALASRDAATCGRHTSPEFVFIEPDGGLSYRAAFLRTVAALRGQPRTVAHDTRVRVYGRLAVISWTDRPLTGPEGPGRPVRTTRLFAKTNGAWLQVAAIATAVQADAGRP
jgi:hypothetical protein